jgi:hypothetical protein
VQQRLQSKEEQEQQLQAQHAAPRGGSRLLQLHSREHARAAAFSLNVDALKHDLDSALRRL